MRQSKTVLVLQHVGCEPPAYYGDLLDARGFAIESVDLDQGEKLPDHHDYAALVVMGGPMGALDDDDHPWLREEREFIRAAVAAAVPYWGVCLGAQLLAAALGSRVYRGATPEVGTYGVELAPDADQDAVFGSLSPTFDVFQWHSDTFDLPAEARLLASSPLYPHQAFAVGSAYGIQFHVEVPAELAREWGAIDTYRRALEDIHGQGSGVRILGELERNVEANFKVADTIFTAWLDTYVDLHVRTSARADQ